MIFTERTITVVNDSATINKPLILYRGDKNIELKITIAESQFKFRNNDASNVIETTDASYAQLVINTPYNSPIFSDVAVTKNGAVIFVITEAMIDEIREVGAYEIQIRLLDDNKQSRASIPPVSNAIEIREPIAIEDGSAVDSNTVNTARVNRALTTTSAPLEAFDSQGNYIKKTWGDGDPITDAALNKMEAAIDGVNKKIGNNRSQIKEIVSQVGTETLPTTSQTLKGSIRELFQFVSNGKTLIASAITDMGVATSNTDSFEVMANNIRSIIGNTGEQPLYKFGLLSDAHIDGDGTDTAHSISDLNNAIQYFNNENCKFIVNCGDVTENGRSEDYTALKSCLATSTIPNYSVRGNHDMTNGYAEATGCADDYTITQNNDLFIFLSPSASSGTLSDEKLNWLENLLTTNTDKRIFFIYHFFFNNTAGNASNLDNGGLPSNDASVIRLKAMIESYSNLIFCNGHSHLRFSLQDLDPNANYYHEENKCYYVHVPSTSRPRDNNGSGSTTNIYGGSEGYLVEVYANKIVFKPIDFISSEYLTKYNYTANVAQGANEPTIPPETPPESSSEVITPTWMNGGINASTGQDFADPDGMRSSYMEFDTNAYTYYITVTNEFEGVNKLRVAIYNPDGSFVVRQSYTSTSLTPGVPGAITFPVTSGKFRLKVDFISTNTLENINSRLVITKVAKTSGGMN